MSNGSGVGSYCYDIALSKVQFSSNTSQFSPNNIRRFFIGGDGVFVQLFVNTGTGKTKQGFYNPAKAFDCFCDKGFKPVMQCLVDLVCSNLEEIIFCTQSKSGVQLNQAELNLSTILKGYSGSLSPDLAKSLLGRFPRLREITLFKGTVYDVVEFFNNELFMDYSKTFSECVGKSSISVQSLGNPEWYKHNRLRPQHYMLDAQGGKLSNYFNSVKSRMEESSKADKIKEMNSQRFGKKQELINKRNNVANNMLICIKKYSSCGKGVRVDTATLLRGISTPEDLSKYSLSKDVLDAFSRGSVNNLVKEESEKYDLILSSLSKLSENCYTTILLEFLSEVSIYFERKILLKVKLQGLDASKIVIPEGISCSTAESLLEVKFSKEGSIVNSFAILLAYLCRLKVTASQVKDKNMFEVSYWSNILSRKEN